MVDDGGSMQEDLLSNDEGYRETREREREREKSKEQMQIHSHYTTCLTVYTLRAGLSSR